VAKRPIVPRHEDWRGKTLKVIWRKADDPKPEFEGTDPHPDLKFTCGKCGAQQSPRASACHACAEVFYNDPQKDRK